MLFVFLLPLMLVNKDYHILTGTPQTGASNAGGVGNTASTSNSAAGASTSAGIGVTVRPDAHTQKVANVGVNSVPMVTNHDDDDAYTDADDTIVVENSTNDGCR